MHSRSGIAKQRALRVRGALLASAVTLALTACAVGPDFKSPDLPAGAAGAYSTRPVAGQTVATAGNPAGSVQSLQQGGALPEQWWTLFRSPELDQLIRAALEKNPSLDAARAALKQSQESYNAQAGTLEYPAVNGQLGATRSRSGTSASPTEVSVYSASVSVSYNLDVFGGSRRQLEGLMAAVDYQQYQLDMTYQTLVANVVTTAIQEASLRAQLDATRAILEAQQQQLDIVTRQLALGAVTRTAWLSQSTLVAQTRAQVSPLEKALDQTRHQLAVLTGRFPGEGGLPSLSLERLTLPETLPVSLPSELLRQRPDIRASEALLHQASAQVGVATANQYPQFNLTGSYTSQAMDNSLGWSNMTLWSLGAGIVQPLFNGGALSAKKRGAEAAYEQAAANYRGTLLKAFQNVADTLRAVEADAVTLKAQAEAERLARETLEVSRKRQQLGGISTLALLDAQRTWQQTRVALLQAQAARYSDTAALFLAMGGQWGADATRTTAPTAR